MEAPSPPLRKISLSFFQRQVWQTLNFFEDFPYSLTETFQSELPSWLGCPKIFMFMFAVNKGRYLKRENKNNTAHLSQNRENPSKLYICGFILTLFLSYSLKAASTSFLLNLLPDLICNKMIKVYFMATKPWPYWGRHHLILRNVSITVDVKCLNENLCVEFLKQNKHTSKAISVLVFLSQNSS